MKHFPLSAMLLVATLTLQVARSHDFAAPRQETFGMLADTMAFADNMNRLHFTAAGLLAVTSLALSFLPRRWRVLRWLSVIPSLGSVLLVAGIVWSNTPQWQPWPILALPVVLALFSTWRVTQRNPRPEPVGVDGRSIGASASESKSRQSDGTCHY